MKSTKPRILHYIVLCKHIVKLLSSKQTGVSVKTDTETNGIAQPEINSHICSKLIFNKLLKYAIKDYLLANGVGTLKKLQ